MQQATKGKMREWLDKIVEFAKQKNASDIFINSNSPVAIKYAGKVNILTKTRLAEEDVYNLIREITRPEAYQLFRETYELNIMVEVPNVAYLRTNIYMQRNMPGMVLRLVAAKIPEIDELNFPQPHLLKELALAKRGLVIVMGTAGVGKSTTLASMLQYRNRNAHNHIVTVEEPIEFVHPSEKSVVIQREVGVDTKDYGIALKNALREAPDAVMIGEIRETETMKYALQFSSTGHICFASMHAATAVQAIERIFNFFPLDQREKLQMDLAENLRCVIAQRLIPNKDGGGLMLSAEMMMNTPYIQQLILEGQLDKIHDVLHRGDMERGVFSFDRCIFDLYERGAVEYDDAILYVRSPNDFRLKLRAESKRPLPPDLASNNDDFSMQSDEYLERELMKKEVEARKAEREARRREREEKLAARKQLEE